MAWIHNDITERRLPLTKHCYGTRNAILQIITELVKLFTFQRVCVWIGELISNTNAARSLLLIESTFFTWTMKTRLEMKRRKNVLLLFYVCTRKKGRGSRYSTQTTLTGTGFAAFNANDKGTLNHFHECMFAFDKASCLWQHCKSTTYKNIGTGSITWLPGTFFDYVLFIRRVLRRKGTENDGLCLTFSFKTFL